ncbi:hypothetical protein AAFN86_14085 [Roseomonas sp. CAU 1739]|uniref:hypothetical protein n=1 Tax=Roseomonas sp. CAU 1739 TaxID=3140364 RepID=UPI00325A91CF
MIIARRILFATAALPHAATATEEPTLEVRGLIGPPTPRRLSLSQLDAMGLSDLETRTPWTVGPQHFSGLPMRLLLQAVGAQGHMLRGVALNDYAVDMPLAELLASDAFLATHLDSAPIPVRLRGPFWIVFPWSRRPELESAIHRQRSIWQLHRIDIA